MAFTVFRLAFSDPLQFYEQIGDPVATQGGAPIPALRSALRHSVSLATFQAEATGETVAGRLKVRRQFRSLANNTPMKLTALYVAWDADPENSGWYMPDQGQLVDLDASIGLATGVFKAENFVWILAGRQRTHRRAMWVYMKDLRTGLWPRDFRRVIFLTDFSALTPLALSYFPPGVTDLLATGSGAVATTRLLPVAAEGSQGNAASGLLDLARVSYEQAEGSRNLGQVIAYDRRGEATGPVGGPGGAWEEFYGPDWPYSWLGPSAVPIDTPVLENGRCRVRWDPTGTIPGWRVDVWNGTRWEEQTKLIVWRKAAEGILYDTVLLSAVLVEYSETRAVIQAVMRAPTIPGSREEVFITLQRGWSGPRVEVYPGLETNGTRCDAILEFDLATITDTDVSAVKVDGAATGEAHIEATAKGTGHTGTWNEVGGVLLGAAGFPRENDLIVGRWGSPYAMQLAVVQSIPNVVVLGNGPAYGSNHNAVQIQCEGKKGYLSAQLGFVPQQAQQALEAENMELGVGTVSTADALASGGKAATTTRTTDANPHVTQATWPNSQLGKYRVFVRVKTSASTGKFYAKTSATTGATITTTSTTYVWLDLGDIESAGTLEIHAWAAAAATVSVDRVEAFLMEDRTSTGVFVGGGRDLGQSCLYDSRLIPTLVTRSA